MDGRRKFFDLNSTPDMKMSDDEDTRDRQPKRKRYDDHQEVLEAFFEKCNEPNDSQRRELSRQLGMEVRHVKYWFQNKRNRMKSKNMRLENCRLRLENEELRLQNLRYKEALDNGYCAMCCGSMRVISSDEHHIRIEDARISKENGGIFCNNFRIVGKPLNSGEASSSLAPSQQRRKSS